MNRTTTPERRSATRVEARLPLQLTEPDTRLVVTTESVDLSQSGIACRTPDYLAPLSKVAMTIILPPFGTLSRAPRSLRAEGVVVRCDPVPPPPDETEAEPEYELACCFTALTEDAQTVLDAFVAWRLLRTVRAEEERAVPHVRPPIHGGGHARSGPRRAPHGAAPRGGGRGRPATGPRHADGPGPRGAHRGPGPHRRGRPEPGARGPADRPRHPRPPRTPRGLPADDFPADEQPRDPARRGPRPAGGRGPGHGAPRGEGRRGEHPRGQHPRGERERGRGDARPRGDRPHRPGPHPARGGREDDAAPPRASRPPVDSPGAAAPPADSETASRAPRQWGRRPARRPHSRPPKGEGPASPGGRKD